MQSMCCSDEWKCLELPLVTTDVSTWYLRNHATYTLDDYTRLIANRTSQIDLYSAAITCHLGLVADWMLFSDTQQIVSKHWRQLTGCCFQHKELIEDVRQCIYSVDILRPSCVYNRILRAIIHHAAECSEIHCPVPWCYFLSRRHVLLYLLTYWFVWPASVVVRTLDSTAWGRGFDSQPFYFQVTVFDSLFAVILFLSTSI